MPAVRPTDTSILRATSSSWLLGTMPGSNTTTKTTGGGTHSTQVTATRQTVMSDRDFGVSTGRQPLPVGLTPHHIKSRELTLGAT